MMGQTNTRPRLYAFHYTYAASVITVCLGLVMNAPCCAEMWYSVQSVRARHDRLKLSGTTIKWRISSWMETCGQSTAQESLGNAKVCLNINRSVGSSLMLSESHWMTFQHFLIFVSLVCNKLTALCRRHYCGQKFFIGYSRRRWKH